MRTILLLLLMGCSALAGNIKSFTEPRSVLTDHLLTMNHDDPLFNEIAAALYHRSLLETLVFATNPQQAAENLNALINIASGIDVIKPTDLVTVYYYQD